MTANDDRLLVVEEFAFCGDGRAVYLQHTAKPIEVGESFVYEFTASDDGGISYTAMAALDSPITHDGPDPKRITIPFDPVRGAVTANVGVALVGIVADGGSEVEEMCSSAPAVEIESLSAADRVIAGLPEATPENSAAVEGSPEKAVIARFEAENIANRTLKGTDRLLALQDFCPPGQRLMPEEITPEMGADRDAAVRRILERAGTTPEALFIGNPSVLIIIPTEAFVLFTIFGEVENWDMGVEWIEIDSVWYHKTCVEDLFLGIPVSYGGR